MHWATVAGQVLALEVEGTRHDGHIPSSLSWLLGNRTPLCLDGCELQEASSVSLTSEGEAPRLTLLELVSHFDFFIAFIFKLHRRGRWWDLHVWVQCPGRSKVDCPLRAGVNFEPTKMGAENGTWWIRIFWTSLCHLSSLDPHFLLDKFASNHSAYSLPRCS